MLAASTGLVQYRQADRTKYQKTAKNVNLTSKVMELTLSSFFVNCYTWPLLALAKPSLTFLVCLLMSWLLLLFLLLLLLPAHGHPEDLSHQVSLLLCGGHRGGAPTGGVVMVRVSGRHPLMVYKHQVTSTTITRLIVDRDKLGTGDFFYGLGMT